MLMANPEHLARLREGVTAWNRWRREDPSAEPDLDGEDLSRLKLKGVNFSRTSLVGTKMAGVDFGIFAESACFVDSNLSRADLRAAKLTDGDFTGVLARETRFGWADLNRTDFTNADLRQADLASCSLRPSVLSGARLNGADLRGAELICADLEGADLERAVLSTTVLVGLDLTATKGLESCVHRGASFLDHSTLQRSRGIPTGFLRGCGVADELIDFAVRSAAARYYSSFISYSSKDVDFAKRIHSDLQDGGVRCWFAPEDMKIGDRIRDTIETAIRLRDKLLVILSATSVASEWVEDEVEKAMEEETRHGKTVLFPVRIDDAVMDTDKGWASKLRRQRHIGDFRNWNDRGSYQRAFQRLLRDLQVSEDGA
jgi:uncharacterized protein YjbI with pentapeptide repeats